VVDYRYIAVFFRGKPLGVVLQKFFKKGNKKKQDVKGKGRKRKDKRDF
jgi:hypothetical protein